MCWLIRQCKVACGAVGQAAGWVWNKISSPFRGAHPAIGEPEIGEPDIAEPTPIDDPTPIEATGTKDAPARIVPSSVPSGRGAGTKDFNNVMFRRGLSRAFSRKGAKV